MPIRLASQAPDFAERFQAFLAAKRETAADVDTAVRGIIAEVIARGDEALADFTRQFDRHDCAPTAVWTTSRRGRSSSATSRQKVSAASRYCACLISSSSRSRETVPLATRPLLFKDEDTPFSARRPIILNGIGKVV